jgi:hypothetical protein
MDRPWQKYATSISMTCWNGHQWETLATWNQSAHDRWVSSDWAAKPDWTLAASTCPECGQDWKHLSYDLRCGIRPAPPTLDRPLEVSR